MEVDGPDHAARVALQIMEGEAPDSALIEMVVANTAAALVVGGRADDFREGAARAREAIASGAAMEKLRGLVDSTGGDLSKVEVHEAG